MRLVFDGPCCTHFVFLDKIFLHSLSPSLEDICPHLGNVERGDLTNCTISVLTFCTCKAWMHLVCSARSCCGGKARPLWRALDFGSLEEHGPGLTGFALNMEQNMSELMLLKHVGLYLAVIKAAKVPGWEDGLNLNATGDGAVRAVAEWLSLLSLQQPCLRWALPTARPCSGLLRWAGSAPELCRAVDSQPMRAEGSAWGGQGLVGHSAGLCSGSSSHLSFPQLCVLPGEPLVSQREGGRRFLLMQSLQIPQRAVSSWHTRSCSQPGQVQAQPQPQQCPTSTALHSQKCSRCVCLFT